MTAFAIPPSTLCEIISGRPDPDGSVYLSVGENCANGMDALLADSGLHLARFTSILDFGCGVGRVIRHVHSLTPAELFGNDINPQLIEWCRLHLPFARFSVSPSVPPLDYDDATFDFIYAFSVFSHLSEPQQHLWLDELRRVLRPHGCLLLTTHGRAYVDVLLESDHARRFADNELVVFNPDYSGFAAHYGECNAFHPEGYLRGAIERRGLEVVSFKPGRLIDREKRIIGQDMWLVRKGN